MIRETHDEFPDSFGYYGVGSNTGSEVDAADSQPESHSRNFLKSPEVFRSCFHINVEKFMEIFRINSIVHVLLMRLEIGITVKQFGYFQR